MRRLLRRLSTLAAAASAVLCVGVCILWVRSYRRPTGSEDRIIIRHPRTGDRLTLRSDPGRLVLYGPPALPAGYVPVRAPDGETAESLVARITDDEVTWWVDTGRVWSAKDGRWVPIILEGGPRTRKHVRRLAQAGEYYLITGDRPFPAVEQVRPLLRALDDPGRAVAAYVVLANVLDRGPLTNACEAGPDGSYVQVYAGLRIHLTPEPPEPAPAEPADEGNPPLERNRKCIARIDPAQLQAVRDDWHRRLDVPVASVGYHWLVAATALPPLLWFGVHGRRAGVRRRRRRRGLCLACGYDLRASAGGCPECGAHTKDPAGRRVGDRRTIQSVSHSG